MMTILTVFHFGTTTTAHKRVDQSYSEDVQPTGTAVCGLLLLLPQTIVKRVNQDKLSLSLVYITILLCMLSFDSIPAIIKMRKSQDSKNILLLCALKIYAFFWIREVEPGYLECLQGDCVKQTAVRRNLKGFHNIHLAGRQFRVDQVLSGCNIESLV